jgi:hypothetical protein
VVPERLDRPLQDFGGAALEADDAAVRLILAAEKATGLRVPIKWSRDDFLGEMRTAARVSARAGGVTIAGEGAILRAAMAVADAGSELPEEQVRILQALARYANMGVPAMRVDSVPLESRVKPAAFTHHKDVLERSKFVHMDYYSSGDHEMSLAPGGAEWLIKHNLMPK